MEMSSVNTMPRSSWPLGPFYGKFHTVIHTSSSLANNFRSGSANTNGQSTAYSTTESVEFSQRLNPTFSILGLCLAVTFMIVGICAWCARKCGVVSAVVNSDAQRTEQSRSKGLDREILAQFPIISYQASIGDLEEGEKGLDCAVCLSKFQQNENIRILPQCNHLFHPECIDKWLASNTTCPLCRSSLAYVEKSPVSLHETVHEPGEASVSSREEPQGAASEQNLNPERKALLILSRSPMSFRKAVQETETTESSSKSFTKFENGSPSRWTDKIKRSRSTESFKILREGICTGARDTFEELSLAKGAIADKPWKGITIIDIVPDSAHVAERELSSKIGNENGNLRSGRSIRGTLKHSFSQTNIYASTLRNCER